MGTIVIGPGGGQNRTVTPDPGEVAEMNYTVVFSGPGGTRTEHFGPAGGTIQLVLGTYRVSVRAVNGAGRLRGLTEQSITIAGNETHNIVLDAVIGVKNFDQLKAALTSTAEPSGGGGPFTNPAHPRNIIVLENNIGMTAQIIVSGGTYIIAAEPETTAALTRGVSGSLIQVSSGGSITLGSAAGLTGNIVIDGATPDPVIGAGGGSSLTIHSGVTVKNGSVQVGGGASVVMPGYNSAWDTDDFGASPLVDYLFFSASSPASGAGSFHNSVDLIKGTARNFAVIVEGSRHKINGSILGITSGTKISLRGSGTLNLDSNGYMFDVGSSTGKLVLRGPKLIGRAGNNSSVITMSGGNLTMHAGEISGNTSSGNSAGGVHISTAIAYFEMHGGTISGNTSLNYGGAVYVDSGSFTMDSGEISGNTSGSGGGVYMAGTGATFNMSGGAIRGGGLSSNAWWGGGVYVQAGTFTLSGTAEISGNTAYTGNGSGGGVYVGGTGNFIINGGFIRNNTAKGTVESKGGGIYWTSGGTFTPTSGSITGNIVSGGTQSGSAIYNALSGGITVGTVPISASSGINTDLTW